MNNFLGRDRTSKHDASALTGTLDAEESSVPLSSLSKASSAFQCHSEKPKRKHQAHPCCLWFYNILYDSYVNKKHWGNHIFSIFLRWKRQPGEMWNDVKRCETMWNDVKRCETMWRAKERSRFDSSFDIRRSAPSVRLIAVWKRITWRFSGRWHNLSLRLCAITTESLRNHVKYCEMHWNTIPSSFLSLKWQCLKSMFTQSFGDMSCVQRHCQAPGTVVWRFSGMCLLSCMHVQRAS